MKRHMTQPARHLHVSAAASGTSPRRGRLRVGPLCWMLLLSACTGTETGNPFTMEAGSDIAERQILIPAPMLTDVWAAIVEVTFIQNEDVSCAPESDRALVALAAPLYVGYADGTSLTLTLEEGAYCGVQIELDDTRAELPIDAPAELDGATLLVEGVLPNRTRFQIRSEAPLTLTGRADSPFELQPMDPPLLFAFDFSLIASRIDFATAVLEDSGEIRIDATTNTPLLVAFEGALSDAFRLYRDTDGDGVLSMEELAEPGLTR
ncbi:MAG: hypothetical protein ACI9KE_002866 [Polyangiales bacterium]|jgi:hypothetical protein